MTKLSVESAIEHLRKDGVHAKLMEDSYLQADPKAAAERFSESEEFKETWSLIAERTRHGPVLDLGSGRGIASFALARRGAHAIAVEPDLSSDIGAGAAGRVLQGFDVPVVAASSPRLPFRDSSFSAVYARQVLHHLGSLPEALADIGRVLAPEGLLIAVREHVVDDEKQLQEFLKSHPVHQLAGGEGAFSLDAYVSAIVGAGLVLEAVLGPWDSVINAFPVVRDASELKDYPSIFLRRRLGPLGGWLGKTRAMRWIVWRRLNRSVPGRMFSFIARKPQQFSAS